MKKALAAIALALLSGCSLVKQVTSDLDIGDPAQVMRYCEKIVKCDPQMPCPPCICAPCPDTPQPPEPTPTPTPTPDPTPTPTPTPTPDASLDAINPLLVHWDEPAGEIGAWPITAKLLTAYLSNDGGGGTYTGTENWPVRPDGGDKPSIGNWVLIAKCADGKLHGASMEWLGPGKTRFSGKKWDGTDATHGCLGSEKWSPCKTEAYLMLSTVIRGAPFTIKERSQIFKVCDAPSVDPPSTTGDAIDPSRITFLDARVASLPIQGVVHSVKVSGGRRVSWEATRPAWAAENRVDGNAIIIVKRDGKWYGRSFEWLLENGQSYNARLEWKTAEERRKLWIAERKKKGQPLTPEPVFKNDPPMIQADQLDWWMPSEGEEFGFLLTSIVRKNPPPGPAGRTLIIKGRWSWK